MTEPAVRPTLGRVFTLAGVPAVQQFATMADLLRRLLAAQPTADYEWHFFQCRSLQNAEALIAYLRNGTELPPRLATPSLRPPIWDHLVEAISYFAPRGAEFACREWDGAWYYGFYPAPHYRHHKGRTVPVWLPERVAALRTALAMEATIPPPAPGTPALPPPPAPPPSIDKRAAALKNLHIYARDFHDYAPAKLPAYVVEELADYAEAAGGIEAALQAWHDACQAARNPANQED